MKHFSNYPLQIILLHVEKLSSETGICARMHLA